NLAALLKTVSSSPLGTIRISCAGTAAEASLEDTLAAGSLCDEFFSNPQSAFHNPILRDSAEIALATYLHHKPNLIAAVSAARNGRKLLSMPELAPDIAVCFEIDTLKLTARMSPEGV